MAHGLPQGFRVAGVHCGLKSKPTKQDLALVVSDRPATAAGVYTQNRVFAAPVGLDRSRTPNSAMRAIVVNSGNANACTGARGDRDAAEMARLAAAATGCHEQEVLVLSTGIIGEFLPMEKIAAGIRAAQATLATDEESLIAAARGMLTTDTVHKLAGRTIDHAGHTIRLLGMAKGAAMIGPRMATMLAVLLTDAALSPAAAQAALARAVDDSFNCISVDGHMSTNDSVLLLANGAASSEPLSGAALEAFQTALDDVCTELARAIPADGEGATHLVTIDVVGCPSRADAYRIAKTVAESPLVKTAVAGADPNWGRIVSAVGYAGTQVDLSRLRLRLNGFVLYEQGAPVAFDGKAVSAAIAGSRDTSIVLEFDAGPESIRFWSTDLTADYVRLNADYHT